MAPVKIIHPDIDVLGEAVDERQLAEIWAPRGWRRAPDLLVRANDLLQTNTADLSAVDYGMLRSVAMSLDVDVSDAETSEDIARLLAEPDEPAEYETGGTVDTTAAVSTGTSTPTSGSTSPAPRPSTTTTGPTPTPTTPTSTTASTPTTGEGE